MSKKQISHILTLISSLLLATFSLGVLAQESNPLPAPTGSYRVGIEWRHWVDGSREEPLGEPPNDRREMMVEILYPTAAVDDTSGSPYIPNVELILPAFSAQLTGYGIPFSAGPADVENFQAHAAADAPLAEDMERFPILIFTHGGAADATMYSAQLEELASHGYVVVGINHAFGSAVTVFPNGRTVDADYSTGLDPKIPVWAGDQQFVIDQLEQVNADDPEGMFTGRLDTDNIGVMGASLGGTTATYTCSLDPRCKAVVSEDGAIHPELVEAGLDQPFLFMLSDTTVASNPAFYRGEGSPVYAAAFSGFEHLDFGDFPLWSSVSDQLVAAGWRGSVDAARAVELTRAYLVAFFDKYLKGETDTLLDNPAAAHPEVSIEALNVMQAAGAQAGLSEEVAMAFVERFDAIFDGPNVEIADEIMADDFVAHLPLAPELDRQGWKDYVVSFYAAFSDMTEEVTQVIVSEDRLVIHVTYTGTHDGPLFGIHATGNVVTMDGIGIFSFDEAGRATENWAVLDVVAVLAQIGAFPPE